MLRFKAFLRKFFKRKSLKRYAIGRLARFLQIKTPACKLRRVSLAENLHFDKSASIAFVWTNAKGLSPNP